MLEKVEFGAQEEDEVLYEVKSLFGLQVVERLYGIRREEE